jgi:hypothetical protein
VAPEMRVQLFADRLMPVLAAELPPDAAGSTALALAMFAVRAEADARDEETDDVMARDIHLLPAFMAGEQDRGSGDDVVALVRRFVQGERISAPVPATPEAVASTQRWARLRELQRWGVDLSLIEITLRQSPTERITNMERQLRIVRQLQQAARAQGSE